MTEWDWDEETWANYCIQMLMHYPDYDLHEFAREIEDDTPAREIDKRIRRWKKEAAALKDKAAGGDGIIESSKKSKKKKKKVKSGQSKGGVKTGRVKKKKAADAPKIKPERIPEDEGMEGMEGTVGEDSDGVDEGVDEIEEV
ncbi:uncharacterized protein J4E79_008594 [Alternaria viburni]|uniref:uncharacterized protein n=1 Tax=Alternaria viburni TaxID=566460 RepID=UPI0020C251CB|nr:uncharacterized protein J4E79_008594 [Alternaria viburni]KAI4653081.1 hypothetical protein J4E79_008594 [Alternaria viburni]